MRHLGKGFMIGKQRHEKSETPDTTIRGLNSFCLADIDKHRVGQQHRHKRHQYSNTPDVASSTQKGRQM